MPQYYIVDGGGDRRGPFGPADLAAQLIDARTLLWRHGLPEWTPAGDLPELANVLASLPPPLAPAGAAPGVAGSPRDDGLRPPSPAARRTGRLVIAGRAAGAVLSAVLGNHERRPPGVRRGGRGGRHGSQEKGMDARGLDRTDLPDVLCPAGARRRVLPPVRKAGDPASGAATADDGHAKRPHHDGLDDARRHFFGQGGRPGQLRRRETPRARGPRAVGHDASGAGGGKAGARPGHAHRGVEGARVRTVGGGQEVLGGSRRLPGTRRGNGGRGRRHASNRGGWGGEMAMCGGRTDVYRGLRRCVGDGPAHRPFLGLPCRALSPRPRPCRPQIAAQVCRRYGGPNRRRRRPAKARILTPASPSRDHTRWISGSADTTLDGVGGATGSGLCGDGRCGQRGGRAGRRPGRRCRVHG